MSKLIISFSLFAIVIACAGKEPNKYVTGPDGEAIFKKYCVLCHGVDGKLPEVVDPAHAKQPAGQEPDRAGDRLAEIKAVAAYSMTLTKK